MTGWIKEFLDKIRTEKKKTAILVSVILVFVMAATVIMLAWNGSQEKVVYKETEVVKGDLNVGVTESGSVTIGTVDQTFDLDMSAYESDSTESTTTTSGGPGEMFQMMQSDSDSSDTTYTREIEIEEVFVTEGQQIQAGDALFSVTQESVDSIRTDLEADEQSAKLALGELETSQKLSRLEAQHTKETSIVNGQLAQKTYDDAVFDLNVTYISKQNEIRDTTEEIAEWQTELSQIQIQYTEAQNILENAQYAVETMDNNAIYLYMQQMEVRDDAKSQVEDLEKQIEELETSIEEGQENILSLTYEMNLAYRDLETGTIEAQIAYEEQTAESNQAQELYDVTTGYLDSDLTAAKTDYSDASDKLSEFNTYIVENTVYAEYDGVITDIAVAEGDALSSAQTLITLNNQDDITIDIDLTEEQLETIDREGIVNINIDAYPDTIFEGSITEVGDAETDSSTGEITYTVTVLLEGELSGLFEGMTSDVTFITKETKEVIYVANRAVYREGTKSYVKMKQEDGTIITKEIVTGFSDGVNVEIVEGLSEGDIVLIESKVSES